MKANEKVKVKKTSKPATKQTKAEGEESCTQCDIDVDGEDVEALACEICDQWICRSCIKLPVAVYRFLEDNTEAFPYICKVCTLKLPELKEMIDLKKSHIDLQEKVQAVALKQKEDQNTLATIQLQIVDLTKANEEQTKAITDLTNTMSEIKATSINANEFPDLLTSNPPQKFLEMITNHVQPTLKPMINTEISERDQIEVIKHNLIISGMAENENTQDDKIKFEQLIKEEMDLIAEVESVARLDRKTESESPKLLRVVFKSMKIRKAILSKATTLRNSATEHVKRGVYIRPELTKKQMEESKNLTTQLRAKREANPLQKFKIYRGQIIEINIQPPVQVQE